MTTGVPGFDVARLVEVVGHPLTDEQLDAVTAPLEPVVVVAGAGTGKTTVMAARVLWLVATGQVAPAEVLGLTFTNKAAGELASRVRRMLRDAGLTGPGAATSGDPTAPADAAEPGVDEPTVVTYHAYAGRLLREHGLRIGVEPGARLLADATRFQLATRVVATYTGALPSASISLPLVVESMLALDAELAEHLVEPVAVRAHDIAVVADLDEWLAAQTSTKKVDTKGAVVARAAAVKRLELVGLVEALRAERRRLDTLDFSDQMRLAAQLVQECPPVVELQSAAYRVVLLDEYQDTSVAQRVLLQTLFGGGHAVTAVGDPCQAIYGWRGAAVSNIDVFPADFPRADGAPAIRLPLTVNNRSDESVLDVANELAEPLREVHPGVEPLVARADRRGSGRVVAALHHTHTDEIEWVADQIRRLVHDEHVVPDTIAVLLRASKEAPGLRAALLARDVPVDVVGLGGLLDVPEVADVVATLEVLDDPTANPALLRLLSGPRWRIGARDLALLGRRASSLAGPVRHGDNRDLDDGGERLRAALADAVAGVDPAEVVSLADALEDLADLPCSPEARERFTALAAELADLRRHHSEPAADLVARVVSLSGLDVEVAALPHGDGGAALAQLVDIAAQFADVDGGNGLHAFLAFVHAARRHDRGLETPVDAPADAAAHGVKLLTVHKAKGLEYDVVFVPTLTKGVFPSPKVRSRWTIQADTVPGALRGDADDRPSLAGWEREHHDDFDAEERVESELEERRLAYVAATRARHTLVVSGHWWGPTQGGLRGPSSYLSTALEHCRSSGDPRATIAVEAPKPEPGETNPQLTIGESVAWPATLDADALDRRRDVAAAVAAARGSGAEPTVPDGLAARDRAVVASWDRDLDALLREARANHRPQRSVDVPASLSATATMALLGDPGGFAAQLARPVPRPPAPAARRGTSFHAWVEEHFRTRQLGLADLVGAGALRGAAEDLDDLELLGDLSTDDAATADSAALDALRAAFLAGPFADRTPLQVEAPFGISLGGLVVRGRIDAVYADDDGGFLVVDWKTGTRAPDPRQLAIYRVACAQLRGVPEDRVRAVFYTVPTGEVVEPASLAGRAELERDLADVRASSPR